MNELKPEDVVKVLEEFASLTNCNNMRYLEGCGHFCKVLREPIDDMAGGRSPKCNEHCEHYSPPRDEELFRAALALLREKDALIAKYILQIAEMQKQIATQDRILTDFMKRKQIEADKDAEIERLNAEIGRLGEQCRVLTIDYPKITRTEAINEFAERLKEAVKYIPWCDYPPVHRCIDAIAEKMKGADDE